MKDMILNPIIPIWLMAIISVVLLCFKRKGIVPYIRQILIIILLFAINLRPMLPSENITVQKQKLDAYVIIVVDDTISMLAEDGRGGHTRFEDVKTDLQYITDSLNGAKFSVIAFNNESQIMCPYTDDTYFIDSVVDAIYPVSAIHATGTNISICRTSIATAINDAASIGEGHVLLFMITDGENTDDNTLRSFAEIGESVEAGAVLGYGTSSGGQMHYVDEITGEIELVMDERGLNSVPAVSKIDESNLEQLSEDLGIPYIHMESTNSVDTVLNPIIDTLEADPEEETKMGYKDIYYWFVIPLAVLVAYEFISVKRRV